jgi:hypothetical protein
MMCRRRDVGETVLTVAATFGASAAAAFAIHAGDDQECLMSE